MPRDLARRAALVLLVAVSAALTGLLLGSGASVLLAGHAPSWILGRAAGFTAYLLLVGLVMLGLWLAHPASATRGVLSPPTRLRLHVSLTVLVAMVTVLHIVVLATDSYAGVGWWGALVPLGSTYRPVPVTLGVIGLYAGLATGLTAALAGRIAGRVWLPLHRVSIVALVLIWLHGVLAGSDSGALLGTYVLTGGAVLVLAISRWSATHHRDHARRLGSRRIHVAHHHRVHGDNVHVGVDPRADDAARTLQGQP